MRLADFVSSACSLAKQARFGCTCFAVRDICNYFLIDNIVVNLTFTAMIKIKFSDSGTVIRNMSDIFLEIKYFAVAFSSNNELLLQKKVTEEPLAPCPCIKYHNPRYIKTEYSLWPEEDYVVRFLFGKAITCLSAKRLPELTILNWVNSREGKLLIGSNTHYFSIHGDVLYIGYNRT